MFLSSLRDCTSENLLVKERLYIYIQAVTSMCLISDSRENKSELPKCLSWLNVSPVKVKIAFLIQFYRKPLMDGNRAGNLLCVINSSISPPCQVKKVPSERRESASSRQALCFNLSQRISLRSLMLYELG